MKYCINIHKLTPYSSEAFFASTLTEAKTYLSNNDTVGIYLIINGKPTTPLFYKNRGGVYEVGNDTIPMGVLGI